MSKYRKLTLHLAQLNTAEWNTTFDTVEEIIGVSLPDSARKYRPWWANDGYGQSRSWMDAGWKTANVDMENERVTFVDRGADEAEETPSFAHKLTIAEAKAGLAASFGVPVESIDILIRG